MVFYLADLSYLLFNYNECTILYYLKNIFVFFLYNLYILCLSVKSAGIFIVVLYFLYDYFIVKRIIIKLELFKKYAFNDFLFILLCFELGFNIVSPSWIFLFFMWYYILFTIEDDDEERIDDWHFIYVSYVLILNTIQFNFDSFLFAGITVPETVYFFLYFYYYYGF